MSVRYATEHRCGVVVRGPGLSDAISGTDPLKDGLPLRVRPKGFRVFCIALKMPPAIPGTDLHNDGLVLRLCH